LLPDCFIHELALLLIVYSSFFLQINDSECFCFVQMSDARLTSETRSGEEREMRSLCHNPTYFQWEKGRVVRVFLSDDDSTFISNVKKGIIDMFQLRVNDGEYSEVT